MKTINGVKYFTVGDLLRELSDMDQNRIVVLQEDSEGNGYRLAKGIDDNVAYSPDTGWSGVVRYQNIDPTFCGRSDLTEEDVAPRNAIPCVVLFPVN